MIFIVKMLDYAGENSFNNSPTLQKIIFPAAPTGLKQLPLPPFLKIFNIVML